MNTPAISVIMPVYNSEEYVSGAIESILAQDFNNYELLLIDDGSIDGSGAICDEYAARYAQVKAFHKENGGMCSARNFAMDVAQGEYLTFMDNDDEVLPGFLADNYALAQEHEADCVRFGRRMAILDEDGALVHTSELRARALEVLEGEEMFSKYRHLMFTEAVWTGLFRTSVIRNNHLRFDERLRHGGEDRLFVLHFFGCTQSAVTNPQVYYVWKRRMGHSASVSLGENKLLGLSLGTDAEYQLMMAHGVKESDPEFFGTRLTSSLMDTCHDMARVREADSWEAMGKVIAELKEIYLPYEKELKEVPLGFMTKWVTRSVLRGHRLIPYVFVRISRKEARAQARRAHAPKAD